MRFAISLTVSVLMALTQAKSRPPILTWFFHGHLYPQL